MRLILNWDSRMLRFILWVNSPTMYLPRLFPLFVTPCRVGANMTDYVAVSFYPPKP